MSETYLFGTGRPCLQDRIDVEDTVSNLTLFLDTREFSRAKELFTEEGIMDYSLLFDGASPTSLAKDMIDLAALTMPGFDATHHMMTNFDIRVDGDTATSRANFQANHWIGSRAWTVWGSYSQQLVRMGNGWRIKHHQCRPAAQSGELSLNAEAAARALQTSS